MDLKTSIHVAETPTAFAVDCDVVRTSGFDGMALARAVPDFVVVEFDFPSRSDLARAAEFKSIHARVPMVVVTVQHSEALAVWFFRERFYDYLVQPLSRIEVSKCLARLEAIPALSAAQPQRESVEVHQPVPREACSLRTGPAQLRPALTLIEQRYHDRLNVADAATACAMTPLRFGREFKESFGVDFREYVLRYRIREACRLLRNPNASVTEIGFSVGFSEPSYFTRMFKKLIGRTPSAALGEPELELALPQAGR